MIMFVATFLALVSATAWGQPSAQEPSRAQLLRGQYGQYRANNDLLSYHLDIRVDPERQAISGKNTVRFRMLQDDRRIQLDLHQHLNLDKITMEERELKFFREQNAFFVDFPEVLARDQVVAIDVHYSGQPKSQGRFGGITFGKDPAGRPWVYTACEGPGASVWWPCKDQWRDEVESMKISVAVPNGLMDVSNGRFIDQEDLGDGYTKWNWQVHYPINSYNVSINVGTYTHLSDKHNDLTLDYYVLPEDVANAKRQFAQVKPMLAAFEHYFGEYPFPKDGFKLIQVPYSGMEHQSAVTYGNGFQNGYRQQDWTGVGVSLKFDFIIIHESGHEWFGNAVSAADVSDMWIHEGWTTYLECLYVEKLFGYEDALKYTNGYKSKVGNRRPIITQRGIHQAPTQDMYFKGALFLHTLRNVLQDDEKWFALIKDVYQSFKYKNILTEDMLPKFDAVFGEPMTPIFNQYLRHAALPKLELSFADTGKVAFRWKAAEPDFAMPIQVGTPGQWQTIRPTGKWQVMEWKLKADDFHVATDLYFVDVEKVDAL